MLVIWYRRKHPAKQSEIQWPVSRCCDWSKSNSLSRKGGNRSIQNIPRSQSYPFRGMKLMGRATNPLMGLRANINLSRWTKLKISVYMPMHIINSKLKSTRQKQMRGYWNYYGTSIGLPLYPSPLSSLYVSHSLLTMTKLMIESIIRHGPDHQSKRQDQTCRKQPLITYNTTSQISR